MSKTIENEQIGAPAGRSRTYWWPILAFALLTIQAAVLPVLGPGGSLDTYTNVVNIVQGGYPHHSPRPYRLWFAFGLPGVQANNPVTGNRFDGHSLLRQTKEELAATL